MMIERFVGAIFGFVKRVLRYYLDRAIEAVKYLFRLAFCVGVNLVIMPTLAFITALIMKHYGVYLEVGPGDMPFDLTDPTTVILTMFAVGIFEEVYFRYIVMDCMMIRWLKTPVWVAIVISSFIFGAAHLMNPGGWHVTLPQAVGATGAGFWFAHVYRKYGLHMAIFTHAIYNSIVVLLSTLF